MGELSRFWTTNGTGDGAAGGYTQAQFAEFVRQTLMTDTTTEGVLKGIGGELAVTSASGSVNVATGSGLVYGLFYANDATVNIAVTNTAASSRIDRIVLRANLSATTGDLPQTIRIKKSDGVAGTGVPPALAQSPTGIFEIPLATVTVSAGGGTITVTDARTFVKTPGTYGYLDDANIINALQIVSNAVTEAKINAGAVTETKIGSGAVTETKIGSGAVIADKIGSSAVIEAKIATGAVTEAKIGTGAVTSGKIGANAVVSGKIAADAVTTAAILNGTVTADKIVSSAVTEAKIATGAVTADKIGGGAVTSAKLSLDAVVTTSILNDAITGVKLGQYAPRFGGRQGGSATAWNTAGTTGYYNPINSGSAQNQVVMAAGSIQIDTTFGEGSATITFFDAQSYPSAMYASAPIVVACGQGLSSLDFIISVASITTSSASIAVKHKSSTPPGAGSASIMWISIGSTTN